MLTQLTIRGFKLFDQVDIELGERVVFVGPNNSGKTSALQAIALWDVGAKRWMEKRGSGNVPAKRPGVTINRRDLVSVPVPTAKLLWRDLRTHESKSGGRTKNVMLEVGLGGVSQARTWANNLEFYYANEESLYCRTALDAAGKRTEIAEPARDLRIVYLPPMSGLTASETRLDKGALNVRIGEGRTAEVLRNLCWQVLEGTDGTIRWAAICDRIQRLFGDNLGEPTYVQERGEITLAYKTAHGIELDISSCGRGQQQTLLLLSYMAANPGSVLLLDEPDAHLEILRQRQIYSILADEAERTRSQIIATSHSEVILNEAADRDTVVAFIGQPHRIDDRGSQLAKSLKEIGFEQYYQAEESGWVLYVEGSTDLAMLRAFARRLNHRALMDLERAFVHYVGNQPPKARDHFYGLREAKKDLVGCAIFDHLDVDLPDDSSLRQLMWQQNELESYLCQRETLLAYAEQQGRNQLGDLFAANWRDVMTEAIAEVESALKTLKNVDPFGPKVKASDEFLDPLFHQFFKRLRLPNLMRKTDYHTLVEFVPIHDIHPDIGDKLDAVAEVAARAAPRRS